MEQKFTINFFIACNCKKVTDCSYYVILEQNCNLSTYSVYMKLAVFCEIAETLTVTENEQLQEVNTLHVSNLRRGQFSGKNTVGEITDIITDTENDQQQ